MRPIPRRLLPHTVTVQAYEGNWGDGPVYGPPTQHPARIQQETKLVRDRNGSEVVASAIVYLRPGTGLDIEGRLTLPGDDPAVILSVRDHLDRSRVVYTTVAVA